jgi:hypothetical protein
LALAMVLHKEKQKKKEEKKEESEYVLIWA